MSFDHLFENTVQASSDRPIGVVSAELAQIADVANMVALAILIMVDVVELASGQLSGTLDGLQHGNAVGSPATHVVDLAGARIGCKLLHRPDHIVAMDVVANLFTFVTVKV